MIFYYNPLIQLISNAFGFCYKKKDTSSNQEYNPKNSEFVDSPARRRELSDFNDKFKKNSDNLSGKI